MPKDKPVESRSEVAAPPQRVLELGFGCAPAMVLAAAVELGVFTALAGGAMTAADAAEALGSSLRGTTMLLDALASLELLQKQANRYALTPECEAYLVRGKDGYLGGFFEAFRDGVADWLKLAEAVKTGRPVRSVDGRGACEEFFPPLLRALHVANAAAARNLARKLAVGTRWRGLKILDVAAGSGVWSLAALEEDPSSTAVALDYPAILAVTRECAAKAGVSERLSFVEGRMREATLEENVYDLAILGNACHLEGEEATRDFLKRLEPAMRAGGKVAIVDMIPNEERTGPAFPLLFALQMLLRTTNGSTFTQGEYTRWLGEAGFKKVEALDLRSHSPAIVASK